MLYCKTSAYKQFTNSTISIKLQLILIFSNDGGKFGAILVLSTFVHCPASFWTVKTMFWTGHFGHLVLSSHTLPTPFASPSCILIAVLTYN